MVTHSHHVLIHDRNLTYDNDIFKHSVFVIYRSQIQIVLFLIDVTLLIKTYKILETCTIWSPAPFKVHKVNLNSSWLDA